VGGVGGALATQVPFHGVPVGAHRYVWYRPYTDTKNKVLQAGEDMWRP
jgi:hypothetical protein